MSGGSHCLNEQSSDSSSASKSPESENTQAATSPSAFEQGRADRRTWELWGKSLTGQYKEGVAYWAGQRSLATPGSCFDTNHQSRGDFTVGCLEAQRRLAASDVSRKTNPEYRAGWNYY